MTALVAGGKPVEVIYTDFNKAFVTVSHNIFRVKLWSGAKSRGQTVINGSPRMSVQIYSSCDVICLLHLFFEALQK